MIKKIFTISCAFILVSCMNNAQQESHQNTNEVQKPTSTASMNVPYTVLNNYFVKNTVGEWKETRIDTQEKFDEVFGAAAVMGEQGKPTSVDFSKESVITIILPETDVETTIVPMSIFKDESGNLIFNYKVKKGNKLSFTTRPNFALKINNKEKGKVTLNEVK